MANFEDGLVYCKLITFWLLWDDEVVEHQQEEDVVMKPIRAFIGDEVAESDCWIEALRQIGKEFERYTLLMELTK